MGLRGALTAVVLLYEHDVKLLLWKYVYVYIKWAVVSAKTHNLC